MLLQVNGYNKEDLSFGVYMWHKLKVWCFQWTGLMPATTLTEQNYKYNPKMGNHHPNEVMKPLFSLSVPHLYSVWSPFQWSSLRQDNYVLRRFNSLGHSPNECSAKFYSITQLEKIIKENESGRIMVVTFDDSCRLFWMCLSILGIVYILAFLSIFLNIIIIASLRSLFRHYFH